MIAELNGKSIFTFVPRLLFQHLYLGIIYNKISPLKKKKKGCANTRYGFWTDFYKKRAFSFKILHFKEALHFERCNLR